MTYERSTKINMLIYAFMTVVLFSSIHFLSKPGISVEPIQFAGPINVIQEVSNDMVNRPTNMHHGIKQTLLTKLETYQLMLDMIKECQGSAKIYVDDQITLVKYALPEQFYKYIDHSTFQPYMCYSKVTNRRTPSWRVLNSKEAYSDKYGFRRIKLNPEDFSINGKDDYVIALGNYYKKKGTAGDRFLIITSTGMYTATVGVEKSDNHTDKKHMCTFHGNGKYAGVIEWVMDVRSGKVSRKIRSAGTITSGPIEELNGKIKYIYKIT